MQQVISSNIDECNKNRLVTVKDGEGKYIIGNEEGEKLKGKGENLEDISQYTQMIADYKVRNNKRYQVNLDIASEDENGELVYKITIIEQEENQNNTIQNENMST